MRVTFSNIIDCLPRTTGASPFFLVVDDFLCSPSAMTSPAADAPSAMSWRITDSAGPMTIVDGILCPFTDQFRRLAKLVPATSVVLEIGCSFGLATEILAKAVVHPSQVTGMDISKTCVSAAAATFPNLRFVKGDALREPMSTIRVVAELQLLHPNADLVVFVDIGGNRELESLVALLPWLERELRPVSIVVKSETLHAAVMDMGDFDWDRLKKQSALAVRNRKQCHATNLVSSSSKIRWLHPNEAPWRTDEHDNPICRFHNYGKRGCLKYLDPRKEGTTCPFNHTHCHACGVEGHRAVECPKGVLLI